MPETPYLLRCLELVGFRAYLHPQPFDFTKARNLAVFAPNGFGKSALVDAIEFVFSESGTLERLGLRAIHNQAGVGALAHNGAEAAHVTPAVSVTFAKGAELSEGTRLAADGVRAMPPAAAAVRPHLVVSPIIRGHSLRGFVEADRPEDRYSNVAGWLQLAPLVEVQKNLRLLKMQVKAAAEDVEWKRRIAQNLGRETNQALTSWNAAVVLAHVNGSVLAPLDASLAFVELATSDPGYVDLLERVEAEGSAIGLAGLRHLSQVVTAIWSAHLTDSGEASTGGAIAEFETALSVQSACSESEAEERAKAANATFEAVWKSAQPLFAEDAAELATCPVCQTPVAQTATGSVAGIRDHIRAHLADLANYANARKALDNANAAVARERMRLSAALGNLRDALRVSDSDLKAAAAEYRTALDAWLEGAAPDSSALTSTIEMLAAGLNVEIEAIETAQGEHTYAKAKAKIDRMIELAGEHERGRCTQAELQKLSEALVLQANAISTAIRKQVQSLLDTLQAPMNDIYKVVQGEGAPPIRLELPADDDANQQRLHLVVDFADNRPSVQPSGYLSDSQIHSVALALRMAAILRFNRGAPFVALDDIVTSYDADHRRSIAALIARMFGECQIILTTHDERFFNYLKDQLEAKHWRFTRIIGIHPAYGPRFADHKVTDAMIEARWAEGESAANEMRQAEEEWLLGVCRDFGVSVRIRLLRRRIRMSAANSPQRLPVSSRVRSSKRKRSPA